MRRLKSIFIAAVFVVATCGLIACGDISVQEKESATETEVESAVPEESSIEATSIEEHSSISETESEAESTVEDSEDAEVDASVAGQGGYILLEDGTKVMVGESLSLSDFEKAQFVVATGNSEEVWYAGIACCGPYYIAEDPECNWAYEDKTASDGKIPIANYEKFFGYDDSYDYFCMELRGVNSHTDYELNFYVNR